MTYSEACEKYKEVCFKYYVNLNLPKDEYGLIKHNEHYFLAIKEFLEENFRDITNNEDNSIYERWEDYRKDSMKNAEDFLKSIRL